MFEIPPVLVRNFWRIILQVLKHSLVRKDNRIITACYKLTLNEQRLLLTAIAKIPFNEEIPDEIEITAHEFLNVFPDVGHKNVHNELQDAVNKLYEKSIVIEEPVKKRKFRWISSATTYQKGDGKISFTFSKEIVVYIQQLKEQFTKYKLGDVSDLKSVYSIRLYEMLIQFQNTSIVIISLNDFKNRFGILEKYSVYKDLRKWVIEPAINELNQKSLFNVTYKGVREGRAIKNLEFFFSKK